MFSYAETTTYGYNRVHEIRVLDAFFSSACHGMVESPAPAVPFLFIQLPRQPCEFISDRSWLFAIVLGFWRTRAGPMVIDQEIEQHYCSEIAHAKIACYIAAAATIRSWLCYREKWGRKQHGKPIYEFYEFPTARALDFVVDR